MKDAAAPRRKGVPTAEPWSIDLDMTGSNDIEVVGIGPNGQPLVIAWLAVRSGAEDDVDPPREVALANAQVMRAAPAMRRALLEIQRHHLALNHRLGRAESRSKTLGIVRAALEEIERG